MTGSSESLCLRWTVDALRTEISSSRANIVSTSTNESIRFTLNDVHSVEHLFLSSQTVNINDITAKYPYLNGLPNESYKNSKLTLLIGANNWRVADPLKIREGLENPPTASKTC